MIHIRRRQSLYRVSIKVDFDSFTLARVAIRVPFLSTHLAQERFLETLTHNLGAGVGVLEVRHARDAPVRLLDGVKTIRGWVGYFASVSENARRREGEREARGRAAGEGLSVTRAKARPRLEGREIARRAPGRGSVVREPRPRRAALSRPVPG